MGRCDQPLRIGDDFIERCEAQFSTALDSFRISAWMRKLPEMESLFCSQRPHCSLRHAAIERARCSRASPPMPKHCRPIGTL